MTRLDDLVLGYDYFRTVPKIWLFGQFCKNRFGLLFENVLKKLTRDDTNSLFKGFKVGQFR